MMNSTVKRLITLLFTGVLLAALLTACGDKAEDTAKGAANGDFQLEELTVDVFADYDLTLVNAFATWCGPCIKEIPELDQLRKDFADKNVNVIGVALDTKVPTKENNVTGVLDQNAVNKVGELIEKTGVTYPMYTPDMTMWDGALTTIESLPTTFFVDSCGNIVGEAYIGARSLEDWTKIVEFEMGRDTVVETREARK